MKELIIEILSKDINREFLLSIKDRDIDHIVQEAFCNNVTVNLDSLI